MSTLENFLAPIFAAEFPKMLSFSGYDTEQQTAELSASALNHSISCCSSIVLAIAGKVKKKAGDKSVYFVDFPSFFC